MTTETHPKEVDKEKQRLAGAISGGIFLISLGIMVAIGLSSGAALIFTGKTWQGVGSLLFFCGIAVAVEIVRRTDVDGVVVGAMILVGIGVIILLKALFFREE